MTYLKQEAQKGIEEFDALEHPTPIDLHQKGNYQDWHELPANKERELRTSVENVSASPNTPSVLARMAIRKGDKAALDRQYKNMQPGFFGKIFGNYSKQFSKLDMVYKAFNNPNHVMYGDMASLRKAAMEYINHKVPNFILSVGLSERAKAKLSATELARTEFALNIVTSIDEQRKIEQVLPQLIAEGKAMESANANNSFIRDKFEQHDFQSNINNEIIQDENVLIEEKENDNLIVAPEEEVGIGQ